MVNQVLICQLPALAPQGLAEKFRQAIDFAVSRHAGQTRLGGEPHANHVLRVAVAAAEYALAHEFEPEPFQALVISAILHDTLEDTPTTDQELAAVFGGEVARIVRALSHVEEKEPEEVYLSRVAQGGELAVSVKFFDRMDNFACLEPGRKFTKKVIQLQTAATPIWEQILPPDLFVKFGQELNRLRQGTEVV